jgi:type IV pilus assembly protein PilE
MKLSNSKEASAGVTLLELLMVVAIVGILAAVGYPSYTQYIVRSNRAVAKSVLLQVAERQEQFFADRKTYAATLTDLGYATNPINIDNKGAEINGSSKDRIYAVRLSDLSATTFTVNAAPLLRQAAQDTDCQTMQLTHTGVRTQTGAGTNCW